MNRNNVHELQQILKYKILNETAVQGAERTHVRAQLLKLKSNYFSGEKFNGIKRAMISSRIIRSITTLVWKVTCLFLGLESSPEERGLLEKNLARNTVRSCSRSISQGRLMAVPSISSISNTSNLQYNTRNGATPKSSATRLA